mmetsp:Transcript_28678/g.33698  ORF Transcript_28678/g.33698 Transcript_28678/m.33698 type:complete len:138 (-) Transcript_28678:184-597(-)
MDKRKLEQFKRQAEDAEELNIHKLINSPKMNEALVGNAAVMFDLEFILRQKAQLKYLQVKSKNQSASKIASMFNHSFLWSPTPMYYFTTFVAFVVLRRKFRLAWLNLLPFMMVPITLDYLKRDYYIKMEKKDYLEFQ